MARHGENIRKRKDGRWEGRYPVYCSDKGKKVYHSVYGDSYDYVKNKMATIKIQESTSAEKLPASLNAVPSFQTTAEKFLTNINRTRKYSTYVKYEMVYRHYLEKAIGSCAVTEITAGLLDSLLGDELSYSMKKSIYCVVNQILMFAAEHYVLSIEKLKSRSGEQKCKSIETMSRIEQEKLLRFLYLEPNVAKVPIIVCLYTGLRLGEVCALKWQDVDIKNRIITVNRTVQRIAMKEAATKTVLMETLPKSDCSKREVPISPDLLELMLTLCRNGEYIFGNEKPLEPRTLQYRFKKYLEQAGLSARNFHTLRHTFATNCVENGADVKSLSEILGHANVQITLNRYVHPSMETKRKQLDELWNFYGQFHGLAEEKV